MLADGYRYVGQSEVCVQRRTGGVPLVARVKRATVHYDSTGNEVCARRNLVGAARVLQTALLWLVHAL